MFDSSIFVKKIWALKKWCITKVAHCISRFCPFLEIQNFELHFLFGGGGGGGGGGEGGGQEIRKMFGDMMKL